MREWRAELWHAADRMETARLPRLWVAARLLRHATGMLPDAVAVRRFHPLPVEEDLGAALRVVARSPATAGMGAIIVAIAVAVDTSVITMSRLSALTPGDFGFLVTVLAAMLGILLPVAASAAAAAAVAWSSAGSREEALRRAIGLSERRVRRQRALQGVLVALIGSSTGVWLALATMGRMQVALLDRGRDAAVATLRAGPSISTIGLLVALGMTVLLGFAAARRRPLTV